MSCSADIVQYQSLKRPKFGPPDVYPQHKDQKEDKLNDQTLKRGFINPVVCQNECGSARDKIKAKGLSVVHQSIINSSYELTALKQKLNTISDSGSKKIQTIPRDQFWCINNRSNRPTIRKFWADLSNCSKSLASIVKGRIPSFQRKEDILDYLAEFQVPLLRAVWFMKISAIHANSISKKRHASIPKEWTKIFTEYLKDNLSKFAEIGDNSKGTSTANKAFAESTNARNRWNYSLRLFHLMYQNGLLDKHEFLLFLIKWAHELRISEKIDILRHLMPVILTYFDDVVENFTLARAAAYVSVNKLNSLADVSSTLSTFEWDGAVKECYIPARSSCSYHDALLLIFSTVLQRISLYCPTALVWQRHWVSPFGAEGNVYTKESPLDNLQCYPASLPFPTSTSPQEVQQLREDINESTEDIRVRSVISEERWIMNEDNTQPSVLTMLSTLDDYNFYTAQIGGSVSVLYKKIFAPISKQLNEQLKDDAITVSGLCEWAVTDKRTGSHRALVVAEFLRKRQSALLDHFSQNKKDEYLFQNILFKYLNEEAPIWTSRQEDRLQFDNLVTLFRELIRSMFNYLKYLTKLISRGDLPCSKINMLSSQDFTILCKELHTLPRHIQYVLSFTLLDSQLEELKQRSALLFGTVGVQASLPIDFINKMYKDLRNLVSNISGGPTPRILSLLKQNTGLIEKFKIVPAVYKYKVTQRLMESILPTVPTNSKIDPNIELPSVCQVELMFLLMELSGDVRSMITLSVDMINRFAGLKKYGVTCPLDIYLSVISVLKKYQTCLLISDKDTNLIYVALSRLADEGSPPTTAEKCILIYCQEVFKASQNLSTKTEEPVSNKYQSNKKMLKNVSKSISKYSTSFEVYLKDLDKESVVDSISSQIAQNENQGQAFVSFIFYTICQPGFDIHTLPSLVSVCAQLTTKHPYLEPIWMTAIENPHICGDIPVNNEWWRPYGIFVIMMMRLQAITLYWLIYLVIYPSLYDKLKWPQSYHIFHLILFLFTEYERPAADEVDLAVMTHSSFRHLHGEIRVLKSLRFVRLLKLLVVRSDTSSSDIPANFKHLESMEVLKAICAQTWVAELCLSTPEKLVDQYLLDKQIAPPKAQLLLHLICNPRSQYQPSSDTAQFIRHILKHVNKWSMRSSHLEIRLIAVLNKETNKSSEADTIRTITDAIIATFKEILRDVAISDSRNNTLWLIPTLINKFYNDVKDGIVHWIGEWLGERQWWCNAFVYCESTAWHNPLLVILTVYLKDKLPALQTSLMNQLKRFLDEVPNIDNLTAKQKIQLNTAIHLRISLIGPQWHLITSNNNQCVDWCMLFLRLVRHPAVDNTGLGEGILFYSILDMLATIVEPVETFCATSEETTPKIINFRKLCIEIWEVDSLINKQVRQLLRIPLCKEEITVVEHTSSNSTWSQRQPSKHEQVFKELKVEGYVAVNKHYVSPWELVESNKGGCNVVPWQELGGIKSDKKLLKMEERLSANLRGHAHDINSLEHELVVLPNPSQAKTDGTLPTDRTLMSNYGQPMMVVSTSSTIRPNMMKPMMPPFPGIMGAPAPNVTITQQGAVSGGYAEGQFPSYDSNPSSYQFSQTSTQQQMFDNPGFIDGSDNNRGQAQMLRAQMLPEQQKRHMDTRQPSHPNMMFNQQSQQSFMNPGMINSSMDFTSQPSQFMTMHGSRPPGVSMAAPMTTSHSGHVIPKHSDPHLSQTNFFDQQFN